MSSIVFAPDTSMRDLERAIRESTKSKVSNIFMNELTQAMFREKIDPIRSVDEDGDYKPETLRYRIGVYHVKPDPTIPDGVIIIEPVEEPHE